MRMPTSKSVPIRSARSAVTSSLRFCKIGLGLRVGATLAAVWKACSSFSRSQVTFMDRYCLSVLERSLFRWLGPCLSVLPPYIYFFYIILKHQQ